MCAGLFENTALHRHLLETSQSRFDTFTRLDSHLCQMDRSFPDCFHKYGAEDTAQTAQSTCLQYTLKSGLFTAVISLFCLVFDIAPKKGHGGEEVESRVSKRLPADGFTCYTSTFHPFRSGRLPPSLHRTFSQAAVRPVCAVCYGARCHAPWCSAALESVCGPIPLPAITCLHSLLQRRLWPLLRLPLSCRDRASLLRRPAQSWNSRRCSSPTSTRSARSWSMP